MKKPFSIRLTEAEREALARLAEREERSAGDVLRRLLRRAAASTLEAERHQQQPATMDAK